MVVICAALTGAGAILLPALIHSPGLWLLLVLMGGAGYGVYTMTLLELGNMYAGPSLVAGNSAFALAWGIGGIAGAPSAGVLMDAIGPLGLTWGLTGFSAVLVLAGVFFWQK